MYRPPVYTCDWERTFFWERNAFSWKIPQIKVGFCSAATFLSSGWFSKAGFLKSAMVKSWTESCDAGYLSPPQQTPQSPFDLLLFSRSRDLISFVSEIWSEQAPSWTARVFLFIFPKTKINSVRQIIKIHVTIIALGTPSHHIISRHFDKSSFQACASCGAYNARVQWDKFFPHLIVSNNSNPPNRLKQLKV